MEVSNMTQKQISHECNIDAKQIISFNRDIDRLKKGVDGTWEIIEQNEDTCNKRNKEIIDALNKINDRLSTLETQVRILPELTYFMSTHSKH